MKITPKCYSFRDRRSPLSLLSTPLKSLQYKFIFHYRQLEIKYISWNRKEYLEDQFTGILFRLDYDYESRINLYVICRTIGI